MFDAWSIFRVPISILHSSVAISLVLHGMHGVCVVEETEQSNLDQSMRDCLFYLEDAAGTVAAGPGQALQQFNGHFAAAWELRQEILVGASLVGWSGLTEALRQSVERLVAAAAALPEAAFAGNDASELFHPSWEQVSEAANRFLAAREQAG